eukprot:330502-Prymnesium_polylepis.1
MSGSPEVSRLPGRRESGSSSGLYRTGDTRFMVVNPSHLMAASRGILPAFGPPPTPDSLVN